MKQPTCIHRTAALALLLIFFSSPANGQSDSTATDSLRTYRLGELIVSASRFEENPQNVGRNVTVITRDEIASSGRSSVADLLAEQPGFHMIGNRQNPGSLQQGFMRNANNNHSVVMIDGVRISDPSTVNHSVDLSELSLAGVERIEIVRGSHSTLYGSSAIGGVVNIITRKGEEGSYLDLSTSNGLTGGSAWTTHNSAAGGYSLGNGWHAGGAALLAWSEGMDATRDTVGDSFLPPDRDPFRKHDLAGRIGYDRGEMKVFASFRRVDQQAELDKAAWVDDDNARVDFGRNLLGYGASAELSDRFTLSFDGAWSALQRDFTDDSSRVSSAIWDGTYTETRSDARMWDNGITAVYSGDHLRMSGGISHIRQAMESRTYTHIPSFGFEQSTELDSLSEHTTGVFLHTDLAGSLAGDRLEAFSLVLGGRVVRHDAFGTHATWEVNPRFRTGSGLIYGSVTTGFNAPSLYQLYSPEEGFGAFTSRGNPALQPEESISAELGWKQPVGGDLRLELSLFRTQVRNVIEYVYLWNGDRPVSELDGGDFRGDTYMNLSRQDINGMELTVAAWLLPRLFLEGNVTLTSTTHAFSPSDLDPAHSGGHHVQVFESGVFLDRPAELDGLTRRPGVRASAAAEWRPSVPVTLRLSTRYVGKRDDIHYSASLGPFGAQDRNTVDGYQIFDLQATWNLSDRLSATALVENLFGRTYQEIAGYRTRGRGGMIKLAFRL